MDDTISRQEAIDALNEYFVRIGKLKRRGLTKGEKAISLDTVGTIKSLPSAEPDVIRCKDCKHWGRKDVYKDGSAMIVCKQGRSIDADGFCHHAERREE